MAITLLESHEHPEMVIMRVLLKILKVIGLKSRNDYGN